MREPAQPAGFRVSGGVAGNERVTNRRGRLVRPSEQATFPVMANPTGNPQHLIASHPHNTHSLTHGAYSPRAREPRAREIAEQVMAAPWATELDELGALELGRLEALIERLDSAIHRSRGKPKRDYIAMRMRATKELREWCEQYGMTPHARAHWAAQLGRPTLADDIAARRAERNGNG